MLTIFMPYCVLDTIDREVSCPEDKPATGRIAVKVINQRVDEVMKVYRMQ